MNRPGKERLLPAVAGLTLALLVAACGQGPQTSPTSHPTAVSGSGGSATLNWTPVVTDTSGAPLSVTGYKIYYGPSRDAMTIVVTVADPYQTTYQVTSLAAGTWYFAVCAYTSNGIQGPLSNVASKSIS